LFGDDRGDRFQVSLELLRILEPIVELHLNEKSRQRSAGFFRC